MSERNFIFLAGLHRSGTSLLHEVIRGHDSITGFSGTGVPEDEGQHLQSVYQPAKDFGGPGEFVYDKRSYMDENHPLATPENAERIFEQWKPHLDLDCRYIIEKSPPNTIRTRFFQKLYPDSKFIVILRHPLAVTYATKKWSRTSIAQLLGHAFLAYAILFEDLKHIESFYILRYEDFVHEPQQTIDSIFEYLELDPVKVTHAIRQDVNDKYFAMWDADRRNLFKRLFRGIPGDSEAKANRFGYSIEDPLRLLPVPWLGANKLPTP